MDQIDQVNRRYCYHLHTDSVLSIAIANLYSYINHEISFEECCAQVDKTVSAILGGSKKVNISPQDGKISLAVENLDLLEQFFLQNGMNDVPFADIKDFLYKKNGQSGWSIEELLQIKDIKSFFTDRMGFFTKNWQMFIENTTTENTFGLNIASASEEVLRALCALENWNFDQVRRCIKSSSFLSNFDKDILEDLRLHGFEMCAPLGLKNDLHVFVITLYDSTSCENCLGEFLIKFDLQGNYNGFPFKVLRKMSKF